MRYLFAIILISGIFTTPAFAQEVNPSLIIDEIEIPSEEFNRVLRDAPTVSYTHLRAHET